MLLLPCFDLKLIEILDFENLSSKVKFSGVVFHSCFARFQFKTNTMFLQINCFSILLIFIIISILYNSIVNIFVKESSKTQN